MISQNNISFTHVSGTDVFDLEPEIYGLLDSASGDFLSAKVVFREAVNGSATIHVVRVDGNLRGVFSTNVRELDGKKVLCVTMLSGVGICDWFSELVLFLKNKASDIGAKKFTILGRRGWGKLYPDFEEIGVIYGLNL